MNKYFCICVYEFYEKNTTSVVFWQQHESVAFLCNALYNHVACGIKFFIRKIIGFEYTKQEEVSVVKRNGRKNEEME